MRFKWVYLASHDTVFSLRALTYFYLNLTNSLPALLKSLCMPQLPSALELKLLPFGLSPPILTLKWRPVWRKHSRNSLSFAGWYRSSNAGLLFWLFFLSPLLRPNVFPATLRFLSSSLSSDYPKTSGRWLYREWCCHVHLLLSPVLQFEFNRQYLSKSDLFLEFGYSVMLYSVYRITEYSVLSLALWLLCTKVIFPNLHGSFRMYLLKETINTVNFSIALLPCVFCYKYLLGVLSASASSHWTAYSIYRKSNRHNFMTMRSWPPKGRYNF